jgi:hypothetical protein
VFKLASNNLRALHYSGALAAVYTHVYQVLTSIIYYVGEGTMIAVRPDRAVAQATYVISIPALYASRITGTIAMHPYVL